MNRMTRQTRRAFGSTWWGKRWIEVLESFDWDNRLTRGRTYARKGNVLSIHIHPGLVKAKVIGREKIPYNVKIGLATFKEEAWDEILDHMADRAIYTAKLLAGEMPEEIGEVFKSVQLSLFPENLNDLYTSCSCPDMASPCRHIAAVYYVLAAELDKDPFLLFELRGITREKLVSGLRRRRTVSNVGSNVEDHTTNQEEPMDDHTTYDVDDIMNRYWDMLGEDDIPIIIEPPVINESILKRLGEPTFMKNKRDMIRQIESSYKRIMLRALNIGSDDS